MKNRYFLILIATITLSAVSQPAFTQTQELPAVADSTALLDGRVTKLEKIADKLPNISGFIQALYTFENTEPVTSQFRIRRARLSLSGNIYKEYADYGLLVEFAGNVKPIDAFIRITPWQQFNVQIGSFRPALTLENMFYGATTMELIDYPQIVSRMTTLGEMTGIGTGAAGRDLGIQAYGGLFNKRGFSILQYYVGVFNGAGVEFNTGNSDKDIAAMVRINPIRHLAIVGSAYFGTWAPGGKGTYADRNRWTAGFMFDNKKWFARGEYIGGVTGGMKDLAGKEMDGNLHTDGAYMTAGIWFANHKVAPVIRAEYFTYDTSNRDFTDIYYTAGIDYSPWKYLRLQLNYTAKTYTYENPVGHLVTVMLTGMF